MNAITHFPSRSLPPSSARTQASEIAKAEEVREAFTAFIGETFYGQMIKSMRATVGKPAYFHGGRAEEVFRSQLDQQLAQEWATTTGERFAEPMFEQQFPHEARVLRAAARGDANRSLDHLQHLGRRR